ncbi:MAG TPA: hypothetical protein VF236_08020 [Gaiellaceae bacterium]
MRRMPSAGLRLSIEAAFLVVVAVGAGLAGLGPVGIVPLTAVAVVLVALVERAYARETARATAAAASERSVAVETAAPDVEVEPAGPAETAELEPKPAREPEPELAVSERSARAILATGPPPAPEPPPPRATEPEPEPEPERPEPVSGGSPREWSIWDLERVVRDHPDDGRQEEWGALILSLREFAHADGTLPPAFDALVRESFGGLLEAAGARTEAAAAR